MGEKRYMISDAAKRVAVEAHVLRYWEDEIGMDIPRNEMGHRYYRGEDIEMFRAVKELKEKGFQLKAIKLLLPEIHKIEALDNERLIDLRDKLDIALLKQNQSGDEVCIAGDVAEKCTAISAPEDEQQNKLFQFKSIMSGIFTEVVENNNNRLTESISNEMSLLFKLREEREEERYRNLDRQIREHQMGYGQSAASREKKKNKKNHSRFFKKYKNKI